MKLVKPHLLVLDTSTLGQLSRHYWSPDEQLRCKARRFIAALKDNGAYVALTFTHICELLRHQNDDEVRNRKIFLERIPLMAWIRPLSRNWFPGSVIDVFVRELQEFINGTLTWEDIVARVREELWETGTGEEIIGGNDQLWAMIEAHSKRQITSEQFIASVARTDPGELSHLTIAEAERLPLRPKEDWAKFFPHFAADMQAQIARVGDQRVNPLNAASRFADDSYQMVTSIAAKGGNLRANILEYFDVPPELVQPNLTIGELGELGVYIAQLKVFSSRLSRSVTVLDAPIGSLPSYAFERSLVARQRKADRVSGSDIGDVRIATLLLYADTVQVDKRTHHHLSGVKRGDTKLGALMGQFCKASDYEEILKIFE